MSVGQNRWTDGTNHRIEPVRMPEATYGSCKNWKRCGNNETVLKAKGEMLGDGWCMRCYDRGINGRKLRMSQEQVEERRERVIMMVNNGIHYKEIAKEEGIAPSTMWAFLDRLQARGELKLTQKKENSIGGRPKKAKIIPFANAKKIYNKKGASGDLVTISYKSKRGKFEKLHQGHTGTIRNAEHRMTDSGYAIKYMYLVKCNDCDEEPKSYWIYSTSFDKKND
jgi:DNA-binding CsgD family transcriptional regulator